MTLFCYKQNIRCQISPTFYEFYELHFFANFKFFCWKITNTNYNTYSNAAQSTFVKKAAPKMLVKNWPFYSSYSFLLLTNPFSLHIIVPWCDKKVSKPWLTWSMCDWNDLFDNFFERFESNTFCQKMCKNDKRRFSTSREKQNNAHSLSRPFAEKCWLTIFSLHQTPTQNFQKYVCAKLTTSLKS